MADAKGAINDYNNAIKHNPEPKKAYYNRGLLKYDQGFHQEAIEFNPSNKEVFNNRGNAKASLDLLEESIKDFDRSIQIDPGFGLPYQNGGITKALSGDIDGACNDWNKAVELGVKLPESVASVGCK